MCVVRWFGSADGSALLIYIGHVLQVNKLLRTDWTFEMSEDTKITVDRARSPVERLRVRVGLRQIKVGARP